MTMTNNASDINEGFELIKIAKGDARCHKQGKAEGIE